MLAENRRPRNIYHLLRHPQGDFNLQRVLLITIYSWGRDRTSGNLSWKLGLPFFWISCRVWRVELRFSFVACLLGNRAPLRIDGAGRFVSNLPALNHTGGERKIHRIVENMRMHNWLDFKNYISYGCSVVQCDSIVRTFKAPPSSYKGRPEVPRR